MADFEDTLNALLSDPDTMGQIMSLAQSLGSGASAEEDGPPPSQPDAVYTGPSMGDIVSNVLGGMDPGTMQMLITMVGEYQNQEYDDKNMALLDALRPFLKEKRQAKINQAVQLARLSRVARVAFKMMKGGEDTV